MGIMDKVSKTFGFSGGDEEKEIEMTEKEDLQAPSFTPKEPPAEKKYPGSNVLDFNSAALAFRENSSGRTAPVGTKITTVKPKDFNDARTIADCLRSKIPVIINFENTETEEAKRIIDFISGTTYALHGEIKKVSQNVFVCAPSNVTVTYTEEETKKVAGDLSWLTK